MGYEATDTNRTTLKPVWDYQSDITFNIANNATIVGENYNGGFYIAGKVEDYGSTVRSKNFAVDNLIVASSTNFWYGSTVESFSAKSLVIASNVDFLRCSKLASITLWSLQIANYIRVTETQVSELAFSALYAVYFGLKIFGNANLTNFNINAIRTIYSGLEVYDNPKLATVYLGQITSCGSNVNLSGNALQEERVNTIVQRLANNVWNSQSGGVWGGTGCILNLSGGTNAAPTGAGITAVQTLISRGCTVTVNGTPITTTKKSTFTIPDFDTVTDKGKTLKVKADGTGLEWVA
jgi:hypothetical protein